MRKRRLEVVGVVDEAHALAAAAGGRLQEEREADLGHELGRLGERGLAMRARHDRHSRVAHRLLRGHLVAHDPDGLGGRTDEREVVVLDREREVGVLGQEAPARMDGLAPVVVAAATSEGMFR